MYMQVYFKQTKLSYFRAVQSQYKMANSLMHALKWHQNMGHWPLMNVNRTRVHVLLGCLHPISTMADEIFKNDLHCTHAQNKYLIPKEEYFQIIAGLKAVEGTNKSLTNDLDSPPKSLYNSKKCWKI